MLRLCTAALVATVAVTAELKSIAETANATTTLSKVYGAVGKYTDLTQLLSDPGNLTVFAPSNTAFDAIATMPDADTLKQILSYHVLGSVVKAADLKALQFPESLMVDAAFTNLGGKGQVTGVSMKNGTVSINFGLPGADYTATVTTADVVCSNGVVHIIDKILMLPKNTSVTATAAGLTELVKALKKADLVGTVDDTASLTIFAPTDAAMTAANWDTLDVETLKKVLSYHVVAETVAYSTALTEGQKVATVEGSEVTITLADGAMVNDAKVTIADVLIKNGVVHVIDKVLMPPNAPDPADSSSTGSVVPDESAAGTVPAYGFGVIAAMAMLAF